MELFDLDALAADNVGVAGFEALTPAIREASSMSSVKNDLGRAAEMLSVCKALQKEALAEERRERTVSRAKAATLQALFAQAVLLYARAVHSSGKGRNKLQILNFLPPPLRPLHDRMTRLRDSYLAHFGEPGEWERHRTVLALDVEQQVMALSYPHESYYVRAEEAKDLETLLEAAEEIAAEAYARASTRLNMILNHLFEDPAFLKQLRKVPFSPESFFSPDEVESYLAGIGNLDPDPFTAPRVVFPDTSPDRCD
jgi:hypothetical protein